MANAFNVFAAAKTIAQSENSIAELNIAIVEHLKAHPKDEKTEQNNYYAGHIAGKLGYSEEKARLVIVRPSAATNLEKNPDKRTDAEQKAFDTAKTLFTRLRDRAGLKDEAKSAAKKESVKARKTETDESATKPAKPEATIAVYKKPADLVQSSLAMLSKLAADYDANPKLLKDSEQAKLAARIIRAARDELKAIKF